MSDVKETIWQRLVAWSKKYDDRDVSDVARRWADREAERVEMPDDHGAWRASMEAAFDAGRRYEQLVVDYVHPQQRGR